MNQELITKNSVIVLYLIEKNLDFNSLFILETFNNKEESIKNKEILKAIDFHSSENLTLSVCYNSLLRNKYLCKSPGNENVIIISEKGKSILEDIELLVEGEYQKFISDIEVLSSKTNEEKFEEFWKIYPTSPNWSIKEKNISFTGSRNLKNINKSTAKKKYLEILNQGVKHEDIIGAIFYEMNIKKLDSVKKGENQMEYFKGMESYLNQERYLIYLDEYKTNNISLDDISEGGVTPKNVTDI